MIPVVIPQEGQDLASRISAQERHGIATVFAVAAHALLAVEIYRSI